MKDYNNNNINVLYIIKYIDKNIIYILDMLF